VLLLHQFTVSNLQTPPVFLRAYLESRPVFFWEVRRQRFPPFWIDKELILRPEYRPTEVQDCLPDEETQISHDSDEDPNSEIDTEEDFDPEAVNEDQLVSDFEEDIDLVPNNN